MIAYYNENNKPAADKLRYLIERGAIEPGVVDERDIRDVAPSDLRGFSQCHFFAGIGVWSYALRQAGWPLDRKVWTGSCPCQPFSAAGAGKGFADERHLWPHWHHLIRESKPTEILGEQVASKDGAVWLDLVSNDLENEGFAFGAADLSAAGFGGAHRRQRHYFYGLAHAARGRLSRPSRSSGAQGQRASERGLLDALAGTSTNPLGRDGIDWILGEDGKWRPVESGTFPLVDATPERVELLRAYGNALDAETAINFVEAVLSIEDHDFI